MRRSHHYSRFYYVLGKLLRGFFILAYGFLILSLLLVIAMGFESAWAFLTTLGPWIFKLGLTLGCGVAILALIESLP
ncbi:MAG: hypothetical protein AAF821_07465 [Cyanobacteria bacterium P01_D01_bin.156]